MQLIGDLGEFNRLRKPAHFSSCSQLHVSSSHLSSSTGKNPLLDDSENERSTEMLSRSLPNPSFEMYHQYIRNEDDFDYSRLKLDDLEFVATLGVGGFGRVELCKVCSKNKIKYGNILAPYGTHYSLIYAFFRFLMIQQKYSL